MAITEFNSNEVRMIVWVKRGDLESWISEGYVVPSHHEDSACGKRYLWSREDIYRLAAFKGLVDSGLEPAIAHEQLERTTNEIIEDNMIKIRHEIDGKIEALFGGKSG